MSIQAQARAQIEVYHITEGRDAANAYQRTYSLVASPKVMWLPARSALSTGLHQERRERKATILTEDPEVFALLQERQAIVVYQDVKYQVDARKDCADFGKVHSVTVTESQIADFNPIGGLNAGGKAGVSE